MNIQEFIEKRPYLYHLTSNLNAEKIIANRQLFSANKLVDMTGNDNYLELKRRKRLTTEEIFIEGVPYFLRDQRPISELALSKCLTDNWQVADFIEHLNARVFMWPTVDRLQRHYDRYVSESPTIFRFPTSQIFASNPHVKFCRLNSGATRANSHLGGKAPERGRDTFLSASDYALSVASVAEVTFEKECKLDCDIFIGTSPTGVFRQVQ